MLIRPNRHNLSTIAIPGGVMQLSVSRCRRLSGSLVQSSVSVSHSLLVQCSHSTLEHSTSSTV